MFALLFDPWSEIKAAKSPSYAKILLYLLTSALFWTVGILFFAWRYFSEYLHGTAVAVGIFGTLFAFMLGAAVLAFFFAVSYHVLDGKAGYYEALATVVLASVAPAVMWFFAGALSFVPYGIFASLLLLMYGHVLGAATGARAIKEYFKLSYAGVLVGALIAKLPVIFLVGVAAILL